MTISHYAIVFLVSLIISLILCPLVIKLAYKIGAVDQPDARKVHLKAIPRIGGLAIYGSFLIAFIYIYTITGMHLSIIVGASIIVITGILDDLYNLSPWQKILGQVIAATVVLTNGLQIQYITVPIIEQSIMINWWIAFPISMIWIIGVTNAVNLIDGLDGLAGGVSAIAATSIFVMALIMGNIPFALMALALIGSILGFLYFNFHPAKIFMGDTGSLLLGFLLAVFSILSFKQVTLVTLIIPIIILAVPITDTLIAIIRRKLNQQKIMTADKNHLHHRLLASGMSHKQAVFFIYGIALIFGIAAIVFYQGELLVSAAVFVVLLLIIELLIEKLSLINQKYKPVLSLYGKCRILLTTKVKSIDDKQK